MLPSFNTGLLAEDLLAANANLTNVVIKRFPSDDPEVVVVNPFILIIYLNGQRYKTAVSFDEYPARVFPKILFYDVPSCPHHPQFLHPNINKSNGRLNLLLSTENPSFHVNQTIQITNLILNNPIHRQSACSLPPRKSLERSWRPVDPNLKDTLIVIGEVAQTVKTVIEIGKLFGSIISFLMLSHITLKGY